MSVIHVTKDSYQTEVAESSVPVLIDFWASWCGPCKMIAPAIEEIADERTDIKVCKVNVDEQPELAIQFGVMSIPMLVMLHKGEVIRKTIGAMPKNEILDFIDG